MDISLKNAFAELPADKQDEVISKAKKRFLEAASALFDENARQHKKRSSVSKVIKDLWSDTLYNDACTGLASMVGCAGREYPDVNVNVLNVNDVFPAE